MTAATEVFSTSTQSVSNDEAKAHVKRVSNASGSSFLTGIKVLSPERREAMYAIYAFCREVDNIADDPLPLDEKRYLLKEWRQEIDNVVIGQARSLTGQALANVVAEYGLQKQDLLDLIDGMEMDADETATRGPDLEILDRYCDRVASAVGRLSVRVFGDSGEAAQRVATSLGRALQLTNILRDIAEDAERDRLYLPRELLNDAGITATAPNEIMADPRISVVCEALSEIAQKHYVDAEAAMAQCSRKHIRPAILMMQVYRRTLDGLHKRGWSRLEEPVKIPKIVKLWILMRYGLF